MTGREFKSALEAQKPIIKGSMGDFDLDKTAILIFEILDNNSDITTNTMLIKCTSSISKGKHKYILDTVIAQFYNKYPRKTIMDIRTTIKYPGNQSETMLTTIEDSHLSVYHLSNSYKELVKSRIRLFEENRSFDENRFKHFVSFYRPQTHVFLTAIFAKYVSKHAINYNAYIGRPEIYTGFTNDDLSIWVLRNFSCDLLRYVFKMSKRDLMLKDYQKTVVTSKFITNTHKSYSVGNFIKITDADKVIHIIDSYLGLIDRTLKIDGFNYLDYIYVQIIKYLNTKEYNSIIPTTVV